MLYLKMTCQIHLMKNRKLEYDSFLFEVLEMDARRILKIKVIISSGLKEDTL